MKIIVVGAGINGVTAALELTRRGNSVTLIDPGPLPYPLAASTDISKAVRAAYGSDDEYTDLAERSIRLWRKWNVELGAKLFHEVGFLCMRQRELRPGDFEYESLELLQDRGHNIERVHAAALRKRFPSWNADRFCDGFLDHEAGYAESGRVVAMLLERAKSAGVDVRAAKFNDFIEGSRPKVVLIPAENALSSTQMEADAVVMATGAWTSFLLPFTKPFLRATGQPLFHLRPRRPELFMPERFPVFGADITSTGYYGFPVNRDGVVKIGNHGPGREMSPDSADRLVTEDEKRALREFMSWSFPSLAAAEIVHTRLCFYSDTNDGNFWIARDPNRPGLVIAAGDCGHGFKFAPVLGEIIADAVEEKPNSLLEKFRWRAEVKAGATKEAARKL